MPKIRSVKFSKNESRLAFVILVVFFIIAGYFILRSKAAIPATSVEVGASASAPAVTLSDSTASASNAVQFKSGGGGAGTYYIIGSGDIAKSGLTAKPTGDQIRNLNPAADAVLTFGDDAYEDGSPSDFANNYEPTWGSFKNKTFPSPGNHDYHTSGAAGYYSYYNATATTITGHSVDGVPNKGYYAFNIGSKWRFYSLNSETNTSEANTWLGNDLKANPRQCVVAYWHTPAITSPSHHGASSAAKAFFTTLYNNNAEIIFVGHNHVYERFYPVNPSGARDDARGIINMTVGTGGAGQSGYEISSPLSTSAAHNSGTYGNVLLTAKDDGTFKLEFLRASGNAFTDSTSGTCH